MSHGEPPAIGGAGVSQGGEAFEKGLHGACATALELAGDLFGQGFGPCCLVGGIFEAEVDLILTFTWGLVLVATLLDRARAKGLWTSQWRTYTLGTCSMNCFQK